MRKRILCLRTLVVLVWLAWLTGAGLIYALYRLRVMHPHFLPLISLLAVQIVGAIAVVAGGMWRVARGPRRTEAAAWMLLATGPVWLWGTHAAYGLWKADARDIDLNLLLKTGAVAGAAIADLEARWRYPYRETGRQVVLWSDQPGEFREEVAAMDRHIERLEALLGRRCRANVHWIRGSLLGFSGRYMEGLVMGSEPGIGLKGTELAYIDQHEVAHFVINHLCGPDAEPPFVLIEGWAEAQSGYEPGFLAHRAWRQKRAGTALSLAQLTSDEWYGSGRGAVYVQGGPLVDYILRRWGGERFFELYSTCRRQTFAGDCRRVLGVSLEQLDEAYWTDIERQARSPELASIFHPLLRLRLGDGVDPEMWSKLTEGHIRGRERCRDLCRRVRLNADSDWTLSPTSPQRQTGSTRIETRCDGQRARIVRRELRGTERADHVLVAAPECSFRLVGDAAADAWELPPQVIGQDSGVWQDLRGWAASFMESAFIRDSYVLNWPDLYNPFASGECTVTGLTELEDQERRLWRIELAAVGASGKQTTTVVVAPEDNWAVQSYESITEPVDRPASAIAVTITYGRKYGDIPIPKEVRREHLDRAGEVESRSITRVLECDFGPTPANAFTLEAFGLDRATVLVPNALPWTVLISTIGCGMTLAGGPLLLRVGSRRKRSQAKAV